MSNAETSAKRPLRREVAVPLASSPEIHKKISVLMAARRVPEQMEMAGLPPSQRVALYGRLCAIQHAIYQIDCYGEQKWLLNKGRLDQLWSAVYSTLEQLSVSGRAARKLTRGVLAYQGIEVGLRRGFVPVLLPLGVFYYHKSCDIRLLRSMIRSGASGESLLRRTAWHVLDIVGEVLDDLTDVEEDLDNFNCNRFVLEAWYTGVRNAVLRYRRLLTLTHRVVGALSLGFSRTEDRSGLLLCEWTDQQTNECLTLLNEWRRWRVRIRGRPEGMMPLRHALGQLGANDWSPDPYWPLRLAFAGTQPADIHRCVIP